MWQLLSAILIICTVVFNELSVAIPVESCSYEPGSPVKTTSGTLYGRRAPNATQISEYLGIPFAKAPVGNLRFAPPIAYESENDIDATKFGHDCPINKQKIPTSLPQNVEGILSQVSQVGDQPEEDCLYMNVWSKPQVGGEKKPVLVWIYGGGFIEGGTNTSAYSGQFWADCENVVFVNFNYRENIFGFPGSPATTQNLGLLDQRLALEWIRENIEGFGGDPERIVIFGQSAGAASIDYYNYAWTSDPIIAGSILESGTAISFGNRPADVTASSWYNVTKMLGCGTNETASDQDILTCMRKPNVSTAKILAAEKPAPGFASLMGNFGPTIDGKTVFENYTILSQQGKFIQKPAIIGNNDYEAGLFKLVLEGSGLNITEKEWLKLDLDDFTCPASTAALFRARHHVPVWRYRYFGMFPNMELPTSRGRAWHGAEILPMFGSSEQITTVDSTWQERSLGNYMRGAWAAFARCPESALMGYGEWPDYDPEGKDSLVLIGPEGLRTGAEVGSQRYYDKGCPAVYLGNPYTPS